MLLFDQNISFRVSKKLTDYFPECKHVSDCGLLGADDMAIWLYAKSNGLAIVTFDADFFDISLLKGSPPKIIWIRSGNKSTQELIDFLRTHRLSIISFLNSAEEEQSSCLELFD